MQEGKELGMQEGLEKGKELGIQEAQKTLAKSMKQEGLTLNMITKLTGLSAEEIQTL